MPSTPHLGKGSNLAIQDAFVLASCAAGADDARGWLAAYSAARARECGASLLYSWHLGRVPPPADEASFAARVEAAGLPTRMLPAHAAFAPVAAFAEAGVPEDLRGFCLRR